MIAVDKGQCYSNTRYLGITFTKGRLMKILTFWFWKYYIEFRWYC